MMARFWGIKYWQCTANLNGLEGYPGRYYGTDIQPGAGYLFDGKYAEAGEILFGDSIQSLEQINRYKAAEGVVPPSVYRSLKQRYFGLLRQGLAAHPVQQPDRGRKKRGKALIRRLIRYHAAVWQFAHDASVPFTTADSQRNQAERDLRMTKVKQKVNGGFRTEEGAWVFAQVQGFCSTARKQGKQIFKELCRALREPDYLLVPFPT
jgi:hypothetical protein